MSETTPKQQLMVARQYLDKLSIFITAMVDFFQGTSPSIDEELKHIKKLLSGKPDYDGASELSVKINAAMKKESKFMQQKNLDTLSQIQNSLKRINELDVVDPAVKEEVRQFIQSLAPEKNNTSSPVVQFEKALQLFRKALSNNVVMQSQADAQAQDALHAQITQELQELIAPYYANNKDDKTFAQLQQKLSSGLEHSELLECCLAMIRFVIKDVIKEASTANKLIHSIHKSLSKINVGIKSTIEKSKSRMKKRTAQNQAMQKQINAIETALSDSQRIEDLKREAQNYLSKMQSSLSASEADERAEQEKMIALLESMQKRLTELEQKAQGYRDKLFEQRINAMTDTLTKLPNRMAYEEKIAIAFEKAKREGGKLCMAILDIDHFKRINDKYGHSVGDKTLQIIATQIKKNLADTDFIARWGGEEFVALMPDADINDCLERLDAMREKIAQLPFMFKGNRVSVTLSIGLTDMVEHATIELAFEHCDELLFKAKEGGRNQIQFSPS
ncbi:diguanylate cyclase [Glaciecola siphonariae]|uniref:diguanylate cyclase n=1 Tax=Glaciecola siphonariae TaxID=521012 RepID=A0ABV9LWK5_9ALTE